MITPTDFDRLPLDQKADMTWQAGTFLDCRMKKEYSLNRYSMSLYALGNFYVELVYDPAKNEIVNLEAFKDSSRLDLYLDKITLFE